jgi:hypothetical protein
MAFDADIDGVIGAISEILDLVLERWKPAGLAGLGVHLLGFAILVRKAQVASSKDDDDSSGMRVQARPFMRAIVDIDDLNGLILKGELVVSRLDLGGILCADYSEASEYE